MKNINWKARLQSGPFWIGVASAVVAAVFAIVQLVGVTLPVTADQVLNVVTLILMIPASIGIISDPTTKGLSDSSRALKYIKTADNARLEAKRLKAKVETESAAEAEAAADDANAAANKPTTTE